MGALKEGSLLKVKENFEVLVFLEKFCPYLFTETHTMLMIFFLRLISLKPILGRKKSPMRLGNTASIFLIISKPVS